MSRNIAPLLLVAAALFCFLPCSSAEEPGASPDAPVAQEVPTSAPGGYKEPAPQVVDPYAGMKRVYVDPHLPHWVMPKFPEPGCVRYDLPRDFAEDSGLDTMGLVCFVLGLPMLLSMCWVLYKEHSAAKMSRGHRDGRTWEKGGIRLMLFVLVYSGAMFWFMSPWYIVFPFLIGMARWSRESDIYAPPRGVELFCHEYLRPALMGLGVGALMNMLKINYWEVEYRHKITNELIKKETRSETDILAAVLGTLMLILLFFLLPAALMLYAFAKYQRNYLRKEPA